MNTSGSSSLAGVRINFERDGNQIDVVTGRTLAGAFGREFGEDSALGRRGIFCRGDNPTLGIPSATRPSPGCGEHLYPLLKGSSSVYFPHVISSIYIPPIDAVASNDTLDVLEDPAVWTFLMMYAQAAPDRRVSSDAARLVLQRYYPDRDVLADDLAEAATRRLTGTAQPAARRVETDDEELAFRREEYEIFSSDLHEGYPKTNLLVRVGDVRAYGSALRYHAERVSLVHKLRETRAFTGFSRIFPEDNTDAATRRAMFAREPKEWLPAVVVRGEGVFLQLRETTIQEWLGERKGRLEERLATVGRTLEQLRERRHQKPRRIPPRFVLLHTLAHVLINELVYECGYGSASLRERIYSADGTDPMAGILIYTAAGDSEGTMGGLVRMGKPGTLDDVLGRALDKARWCSTDPVCIESWGQGPDNCNLAACHSCALLPETACEELNRILDRGVLVGTLRDPTLGFFSSFSE